MKNYFEVNWVTKDTQWDITFVWYYAFYDWWLKKTKYALSVKMAIWMIENNYEFRSIWSSPKQKIIVVTTWDKKYLRTVKDWKPDNNLDNLPSLPVVS